MQRAESDLRASVTLAEDREMADDVVGFHAQQAVEKALKAVLVLEGVSFPRTHDLELLAARVRERNKTRSATSMATSPVWKGRR